MSTNTNYERKRPNAKNPFRPIETESSILSSSTQQSQQPIKGYTVNKLSHFLCDFILISRILIITFSIFKLNVIYFFLSRYCDYNIQHHPPTLSLSLLCSLRTYRETYIAQCKWSQRIFFNHIIPLNKLPDEWKTQKIKYLTYFLPFIPFYKIKTKRNVDGA